MQTRNPIYHCITPFFLVVFVFNRSIFLQWCEGKVFDKNIIEFIRFTLLKQKNKNNVRKNDFSYNSPNFLNMSVNQS